MKKGLITSILALTFTGLQAQPLPATPKLVVTLTIDQLRTDYMEAFSTLYGEKGFKRLMREGKVFYQTEFPFNGTDRASAIAAIYSGTTPSMNGIISQYWMDASTLRPVNCVDDGAFMGNFTDENSSPSQLLTSTIADELKVATRNKGLVYAIAPSARRGRTGCRTYRKRCFLAEREHRQMVQHYILQRVPVVGKPVQRTEITRLPHPRHGMGTGTPHQQIYIPARMAGPALQI